MDGSWLKPDNNPNIYDTAVKPTKKREVTCTYQTLRTPLHDADLKGSESAPGVANEAGFALHLSN